MLSASFNPRHGIYRVRRRNTVNVSDERRRIQLEQHVILVAQPPVGLYYLIVGVCQFCQ